MTTLPILEVKNAEIAYGDLTAIWDISMTVQKGRTTALMGRNGAGKSTLLSAIAGLLPFRSGTVRLAGQDLLPAPAHKRVSLGVSLVQEGKRVFRDMTVAENLALGTFSRSPRGGDQAVKQMLERFPRLRPRLHDKAGALSGGQQQMLAIAQALLAQPRLLMLDEPTSGLAPIVVEEVLEIVRGLKDQDIAIIYVEQVIANVMSGVADDVVVVDGGRVVLSGTAGELSVGELELASRLA
ncbi:ABC transporter ATP-binding protein [Arthrobacter sp. AZCC_0090]|uniref:ABC transporter ATP-binding protein n=1 Tax=Arthrobacter sp. AZCC_0090 TaxID=2735881 RepID=UPI001616759F|nr:ABC transporter ATP-binding protein [Arthrobacter sp. AZCC_0090]MBB6405250.1 branched-chain amino acid transport system ATP-binding protein [Arthrobacter sp. AZCC_0090]